VNRAAVSYVEREDGRILCVWNSRYGGWALPGGKVEEGETVLLPAKHRHLVLLRANAIYGVCAV